ALLAAELGLMVPDLPWHTERDRVAEVAAGVGIVAGAMAKIANDLLLLAQTEVGEVAEARAPGKGGSSAMPQKRNPVDATLALAAARLALGEVPVVLGAMVQAHERAAGEWQAEWDAVPRLFCLSASAVERIHGALAGLEIDAARMRTNLDASGGVLHSEALSMALAIHVGRTEAQRIVRDTLDTATSLGIAFQQAARDATSVRALLALDEIERVFDPNTYLGSSDLYIDRALKNFRALQGQGAHQKRNLGEKRSHKL
ncbi:MAG: lyase family protein, partial [Ktedonobacterales bacterium]